MSGVDRVEPPDADEGGEPACWMHLLDDLESDPTRAPTRPPDIEERSESADQPPSD